MMEEFSYIGIDRSLIDDLLLMVDSRTRLIIEMRFGLNNGCPKTLAAIGKEVGCGPDRVRQILNKTFLKWRRLLEQTGPTYQMIYENWKRDSDIKEQRRLKSKKTREAREVIRRKLQALKDQCKLPWMSQLRKWLRHQWSSTDQKMTRSPWWRFKQSWYWLVRDLLIANPTRNDIARLLFHMANLRANSGQLREEALRFGIGEKFKMSKFRYNTGLHV